MKAAYDLSELDNTELLISAKRLANASNGTLAQLLAHLAEVEARGVHHELACPSLYTYCVHELRMSEDEAQRRSRAARAARQFPMLFDMLADGSIHLTGIVLLAPHLTPENHRAVLRCARFCTKREIEKLVADIAPRPAARAKVEALAPAAEGGASRYAIQFTADQEYADLLDEARDLLPDEVPERDVVDLHRLALRSLVEALSRQKLAARNERPAVSALARAVAVACAKRASPAPERSLIAAA